MHKGEIKIIIPEKIQNQFEVFMDNIPGSIYWKDAEGFYLGCNAAVLKKGNLNSKDDVIGKTDFDLWPAQAENFRKTDLEVMQSDKIIEAEEAITLVDGSVFHFLSIKSPLKDNAGNIIGIIGNSTDITELKIAKEAAEAASLVKTQFLALMSHELRIPLAAIISSANLLLNTEVTPAELITFSTIIQTTGEHLLSTIESILDFAKLEANKFDITLRKINLNETINEVATLLKIPVKEKNIDLIIRYDPLLPDYVITDSRLIRIIMTNLISNALKFTDKGSVLVEAFLVCATPQSVKFNISVTDTGIGIPPDKIDFIFDKFTQIENGYIHKKSLQGTGLGLSIVKKLIALVGGSIQVTSRLGKGSRFELTMECFLPEQQLNLASHTEVIHCE